MKRLIALLLALILVFALVGCASGSDDKAGDDKANTENKDNDSTDKSGDPNPIKIAYVDATPQNSTMQAMYNSAEAVVKAVGGEMVIMDCGSDADETIAAIEAAINAGVDGLMFTPSADSMLPTVMKLCEDAGVYFAITFRSINDEEVKEMVEACPYYAGNTYESEYDAGYYVADLMAKKGVKQLAFFAIQKGDTTCDAREAGMRKACEENNIEVIGELRSPSQASEVTEAMESWIGSYPNLDGVMVLSSQTAGTFEAVYDAIESNNKIGKIFMGSCDFSDDMVSALESGTIAGMCGGHTVPDRAMCAVILVNAVLGTPLNGDEPASLCVPFLYLDNAEDAQTFQDLALGGDPIYNEEECRELLLGWYNEGLNQADVQAVADNWSMSDLAARHSK